MSSPGSESVLGREGKRKHGGAGAGACRALACVGPCAKRASLVHDVFCSTAHPRCLNYKDCRRKAWNSLSFSPSNDDFLPLSTSSVGLQVTATSRLQRLLRLPLCLAYSHIGNVPSDRAEDFKGKYSLSQLPNSMQSEVLRPQQHARGGTLT